MLRTGLEGLIGLAARSWGDGKSIPVERQARTNRLPFLAAAINAEHRAAFGAAEKALEHAAECGRHLIEAKALVPHGDWLPWLKANTEVVPRQSQKYMRLANHWEQVSAKSELGGSHLALNDALQLIADPKPKPQPKRRCISAAEIGEVTLIYRGWIPDFTPKGGGGPWPADIAAFYAECAKIGPPFEVLTWQRKAAKFHWSGWLPEEESEGEDRNDDEDLDADLDQALADEELLIEERLAEKRERRAEGERLRATLPNGTKKHCPHCGGVLP